MPAVKLCTAQCRAVCGSFVLGALARRRLAALSGARDLCALTSAVLQARSCGLAEASAGPCTCLMLLLASAAARVTSHLVVVGWHWAALPLISPAAVIPAAASRVPCHSPRLAK